MCGMICWLRLTSREAAMRSVLRGFADTAYFRNDAITSCTARPSNETISSPTPNGYCLPARTR
jgi:hypothetical protein